MPLSDDGFYRYRVKCQNWETWLITPLPLPGLDDNVSYPIMQWLDASGGIIFFVLTMPDGQQRRFVNHPYSLDIDARDLISPALTWGEMNARA